MSILKNGEIRKVKNIPGVLIMCTSPFNVELTINGDDTQSANMYILTNHFPKTHWVIIIGRIKSIPEGKIFYSVRLLTTTDRYGNIKVEPDMVKHSTIDTSISYFTRDIFLVPENEFDGKLYGEFDLDKLNSAIDYI